MLVGKLGKGCPALQTAKKRFFLFWYIHGLQTSPTGMVILWPDNVFSGLPLTPGSRAFSYMEFGAQIKHCHPQACGSHRGQEATKGLIRRLPPCLPQAYHSVFKDPGGRTCQTAVINILALSIPAWELSPGCLLSLCGLPGTGSGQRRPGQEGEHVAISVTLVALCG